MSDHESRSQLTRSEVDELVNLHLPLAGHIVRETVAGLPAHIDRDELTSAAMTALVRAAQSFRCENEVPFARWASLKIRGALLDEMRNRDWASRSVRARARQREVAADAITAELGRLPTKTELAARLGITPDELKHDENDVHRAVVLSLSAPMPGGVDTVDLLPADKFTPERFVLQRERSNAISDAVELLPERLRAIVVGYYLEDRPMAELAAELGVTESRVSQLRAEAIGLLRSGLRDHLDGLPAEGTAPLNRRNTAYLATLAARSGQVALAGLPQPRAHSSFVSGAL